MVVVSPALTALPSSISDIPQPSWTLHQNGPRAQPISAGLSAKGRKDAHKTDFVLHLYHLDEFESVIRWCGG